MKDDLISRSALMESLRKHYIGHVGMEESDFMMTYRSFCQIINELQTAYDVDKVDEQILEYYKAQIDKGRNGWDLVDDGVEVRRIVRNGGKE